MRYPISTNPRAVAAVLTFGSLFYTPWLGQHLLSLPLYFGTPGQSWQFYSKGCLAVLAITAVLIWLWVATARALYRVWSQQKN
jgi:hypothetical protein